MKAFAYVSCICFLFSAACTRHQEHKQTNQFSPRIVEARGHVFAQDSIVKPTVVPAGKPKAIKAGKPAVFLTNTNIVPAGKPGIVVAGTPKMITPGQDGIPFPKIVTAIDSPFVAGAPTVWPVKDTYFKDNFPKPNSAFIKLRGLSLALINCITKDNNGNIWIGTNGGATRFNGKFTAGMTVREGLVFNTVYSILQDSHGNMWFGGMGGVSRFDGKYMTRFNNQEVFKSVPIRAILEDKSGKIWFGTDDGSLVMFNGKSFTIFSREQGLPDGSIMTLAQDETGNIWFGSEGLCCYDGKSLRIFTKDEGLSNDGIQRILTDKKGNLWIASAWGGISYYDGNTFTNFTEKEGFGKVGIWDMSLDLFGNLWFATVEGGVCRFDGRTFASFTDQKDLVDNEATAIYCDHSGNTWVGGGKTDGLMRYNDVCFSHYTTNEGLSSCEVFGIMKDKSGKLWIGTLDGDVNLFDGQSFTQIKINESQSYKPIMQMIQAVNGDIWLATLGAGLVRYDGKTFYRFTEKEGLAGDDLRCVMQDKEGNIWIGTEGSGLCRYDGKTFMHFTRENGLNNDTYISIFQDNTGIIWFGAESGGVTSYNGKTFTHYTEKQGFCNKSVKQIFQDKNNYLWFCTVGKGAIRYDGKVFMYFTDKEGLKHNNVNGMLQARNGSLCFASGSGLSILRADYEKKLSNKSTKEGDYQTVLFRNFFPEDGFSGWGCNGAIVEDDSGTIWISSSDRLTRYFPTLDVPDTTAPAIQLTGVQLYNENIPWLDLEKNRDSVLLLGNGVKVRDFEFDSIAKWYAYPENLSLAYNNNYVTFIFIGITSKLNTKVTYKYKLEGNDQDWSTFSSLIRLDAPYGNLAPGNYTFKVKAMSSEGYWSKELAYSFTIRPPWWKTWWAYSGYILLFIGAIWFTIWSVIENQRKKIRLIVNERNRIARELHDDIGAELTRITMLSQILQKNDKVEGDIREKLRKISETGKKVLASLGEIIWTMNPRKDNLDSLAAYIRRFVTEYLETNGIDIRIEFPAEIPARDISDEYRRNVFLVVKEAISNISKYSKATSVRMSMTFLDKLAEVEIADNGTGFSVREKENWGNGLRNMNQRMKDIGGSFLIKSEINQGTVIRLTFPVR